MTTPPLSGRRAQAARNDEIILAAARAVFTSTPGAPISAVAEKAGVGMSALYRRYRSKEELLQQLSLGTLNRYLEIAQAALAEPDRPGEAFSQFMYSCLEAGAGSLSISHAGSFTVTPEIIAAATTAHQLTTELLGRAKKAGALRPEIAMGDVTLILEQLQAVKVSDPQRTATLRQRYLAIILAGLKPAKGELPGPPPEWAEISRRYES